MPNPVPSIPVNNPLIWQVSFGDANGQPFDPTSGIEIVVNDPNGRVTILSYSSTSPSDLTRISEGIYQGTTQATLAGDWVGFGRGVLSDGTVITSPDFIQPVSRTNVSTT